MYKVLGELMGHQALSGGVEPFFTSLPQLGAAIVLVLVGAGVGIAQASAIYHGMNNE